MATLDVDIFSFATMPDDDLDITFAPYSNYGGSVATDHQVVVFLDGSTKTELWFAFVMPQQFVGTPKIVIQWTSQANTGNVVWDAGLRGIKPENSELLNQATFAEEKTVTDAAPGTAHHLLEASMTFTASNFEKGDLIKGYIARDKVNAADTMADEALVASARLTFTDV